jgi:hypothetical protein
MIVQYAGHSNELGKPLKNLQNFDYLIFEFKVKEQGEPIRDLGISSY